MTNADNNLDAESDHNSVDPTSIQAKHLYTALEATYPFTVPLVNHHNILSATSEPPQHPPGEENNLSKDQTELGD